jgi:hypothetical protein
MKRKLLNLACLVVIGAGSSQLGAQPVARADCGIDWTECEYYDPDLGHYEMCCVPVGQCCTYVEGDPCHVMMC